MFEKYPAILVCQAKLKSLARASPFVVTGFLSLLVVWELFEEALGDERVYEKDSRRRSTDAIKAQVPQRQKEYKYFYL